MSVYFILYIKIVNSDRAIGRVKNIKRWDLYFYMLNMELDLQSIFVLIYSLAESRQPPPPHLGSYTVGTQSIARAQSIAPRHSTYVITPKKPKFRKFLFGKTKKEDFARRFFKKTSVFSRLKL